MPNVLLQEYQKNKNRVYSTAEAQEYCEHLAKTHYENFSLGSKLIPKAKRQHVYNVYAFCRWADDLGDEMESPQEALEALKWWKGELDQCYEGKATHPVFVALRQTILEFDIPKTPFADLIHAFTMDQSTTRWPDIATLLYYCKHSANPVGHLFLYLFGYRDEERQRLSDCTCTALQLTNFWQDVSVDLGKGRIYIPLEDLQRFGLTETELREAKVDQRFRELMKFEVQRTRALFDEGLKLLPTLDSALRLDVELFSRGGMKVLELIEEENYDVFRHRPSLSKTAKAKLFLGAYFRSW